MDTNYIIDKLIELGVPAHHAEILGAVAKGESGYRSFAEGDSGNSWGLFQIYIPAHWDKLERWTGSSDRKVWIDWLKNPENNIFAASQVYRSQGLGAWTVYKTGAYKPYLGQIFSVEGEEGSSSTSAGWKEIVNEVGTSSGAATGSYWDRWLKYQKLLFTGKWAEAEAYRATWPIEYTDKKTGEKVSTTEAGLNSEVQQKISDDKEFISTKIKMILGVVVGLAIGILGLVLMGKSEISKLVMEGVKN